MCRLSDEVTVVSPTGQARGLGLREAKSLSWGHRARKRQVRDESTSVSIHSPVVAEESQ